MSSGKRFFVTMVAIIKDEAPYLAEWIEYHMLRGVEHVYLYDNGSSDCSADILADYQIQGRVTLLSWPEHPGQLSAYNHALKIFGRDSEWMAVIDVDEFIYLPPGQDMPQFLSAMGDADQVLLPWYHFGNSGHDEQPCGLVIENFVHRAVAAHRQTKYIVRPEAAGFADVHHCETNTGRTVDGTGRAIPERWIQPQPLPGEARIHHYFTKSRAEFAAKLARGQSDGGQGKTMADFDRHATPQVDDRLASFGPAVRDAMARTVSRGRRLSTHAPLSAQSELTPSRPWHVAATKVLEAMRAALPAHDNGHLSVGIGHGVLADVGCPDDVAAKATTALCDAIGAEMLVDLAGEPMDMDVHTVPPDDAAVGTPFLAWQGRSDGDTSVIFIVEGIDAGGKAWRDERRLAVRPAGTLAFLILSERSMAVRSVRQRVEGPERVTCARAAIYRFV